MFRKTAFFLLSLLCVQTGCLSERVIENSRVPEIEVAESGIITFNGHQVKPGKVAAAVRAADFRRDQEITIRMPDKVDVTLRNALYSELIRGGYKRIMFVKARKATSSVKQK